MNESMAFFQVFTNLPLIAMVLARLGGFIAMAPFFGGADIPVPVRGMLTFFISVLVIPFVRPVIDWPADAWTLAAMVVSEFMIGLMFGLVWLTIFTGLELASQMMGQQMGIGMAQVFDPMTSEESTVFGQLYYWVAIMLFLIIGGHHVLLGAVISSFQSLPPGDVVFGEEWTSLLTSVLTTAFIVALKVSAPVLATIFLSTVAVGFISRTVPQLNILSVGFPIRDILGFILAFVCFGAAMDVFMGAADGAVDSLLDLVHL